MSQPMFTYNEQDAMNSDLSGGMSKGGLYFGVVESCTVQNGQNDRRQHLVFKIKHKQRFDPATNSWVPDESTNNYMKIQVLTKEGETCFGAKKISALLGILGQPNTIEQVKAEQQNNGQVMQVTHLVNFEGAPVLYSCFRKDRWYEEKKNGTPTGVMKIAYDFEHLHFFYPDPGNIQTFSERKGGKPAAKWLMPITDELVDPNTPPAPPSRSAGGFGGGFGGNQFGGGFNGYQQKPQFNGDMGNGSQPQFGNVQQPQFNQQPQFGAQQANPFANAMNQNPAQQRAAVDDAKNAAFMQNMTQPQQQAPHNGFQQAQQPNWMLNSSDTPF